MFPKFNGWLPTWLREHLRDNLDLGRPDRVQLVFERARTTCGEIMNLCADYAEPSEELGAAALAFR